MEIEDAFDGGSIEVLGQEGDQIALAIEEDSAASFRQWFCFRVSGAARQARSFVIVNAGDATYPAGFDDYAVMASYDQRRWFRVPTSFDGERLEFLHTSRARQVTYAYFAPYSLERRERLWRRVARAPWGQVERVAATAQERSVGLVILGEESPDRPKLWVTARQHPGETMAEWFAEGLIERMLDEDDPVTQQLLARATLYVVPCVNPDGAFLGNLRTNALGVDLNRCWDDPDDDDAPEVAAVRRHMLARGVDLFLDVHGDERNPFCFLVGCEGNPGYDDRLRDLENLFEQSLCEFNADFQDEYGYPRDEPGEGDLSAASNYVGDTFDCLAMTLEMPFKDNAHSPDEVAGWSPERSRLLGASVLESMVVCLDSLR